MRYNAVSVVYSRRNISYSKNSLITKQRRSYQSHTKTNQRPWGSKGGITGISITIIGSLVMLGTMFAHVAGSDVEN
jgi:hypothetical protein